MKAYETSKDEDKEWWMPSKILKFRNDQKAEREKVSLDEFCEALLPELLFYQEFEMYERGLKRIESLNMPEQGSEHVILAYFKLEFLSQTFKESDIYDFVFIIDKKKEQQYKKQNFHLYL